MTERELDAVKGQVVLCVGNAKLFSEKWYLYYDIVFGHFSVTNTYRRDWHFLAWPGGRREMSPDFAKVMGYAPEQVTP